MKDHFPDHFCSFFLSFFLSFWYSDETTNIVSKICKLESRILFARSTAWRYLLYERVSSRLWNNQISPLDDDDRHEVRSLAGVFEDLSVLVGLQIERFYRLRNYGRTNPFLSIWISDAVEGSRIPLTSEVEQIPRKKTVVSHDPEIGKESGGSLNKLVSIAFLYFII